MNGVVTRWNRIFFISVSVFAGWVGAWCYFVPSRADMAIPWLVPPLHARFIGALYLAGVVAMLLACGARRWIEVRIVTLLVGIWTGMLFLITMLRLDDFDFGTARVWIWTGAYAYMPVVAVLFLRQGRLHRAPDAAAPLTAPTRAGHALLGCALVVLAFALLFFTDRTIRAWPWKIDPLLAQIYSGPFLALGVMNLMIARSRAWMEVRIAVATQAVFAMLVLIASLAHRSLFVGDRPASWFWFIGVAASIGLCGTTAFRGVRRA